MVAAQKHSTFCKWNPVYTPSRNHVTNALLSLTNNQINIPGIDKVWEIPLKNMPNNISPTNLKPKISSDVKLTLFGTKISPSPGPAYPRGKYAGRSRSEIS